jgi:hypothetical protein
LAKHKTTKQQNKRLNMTNQKATTETEVVAGKDIGAAPKGMVFAAANPGEDMPDFVPGKNWKVGQNLSGKYVGTERIYSDKFTAGKKDTNGKIYRDLHTLEDLTTAMPYGIWSVGVLGNFFAQVPVGAPVSITYTGVAAESFKPGQNPPHTFDFSLGEGYRLQRAGAQATEVQPNLN